MTKHDKIQTAWTAGRVAGYHLRGIATNPYKIGSEELVAWETGYKAGRILREREQRISKGILS